MGGLWLTTVRLWGPYLAPRPRVGLAPRGAGLDGRTATSGAMWAGSCERQRGATAFAQDDPGSLSGEEEARDSERRVRGGFRPANNLTLNEHSHLLSMGDWAIMAGMGNYGIGPMHRGSTAHGSHFVMPVPAIFVQSLMD